MYSLHEQYTVYYYSNGVSNMFFGVYVNHLYMTIYTCLTGILLFITQDTRIHLKLFYIFIYLVYNRDMQFECSILWRDLRYFSLAYSLIKDWLFWERIKTLIDKHLSHQLTVSQKIWETFQVVNNYIEAFNPERAEKNFAVNSTCLESTRKFILQYGCVFKKDIVHLHLKYILI